MKPKNIATTIHDYLKGQKIIKENLQLIDTILDKINRVGKVNLSFDERTYLKQYNDGKVDPELEKWLLSQDENTFDDNGNKLLFDEFETDEDLFYNLEKLKRVLTKHLNKNPFTNNADWGGGYVWAVKGDDNFTGTFFYLNDEGDELTLLKRESVDDTYQDEVFKHITNPTELYDALRWG